MSDARITELQALPEASVASLDVLPIADISAAQTKKVTVKDLTEAGIALADAGSIDLAKLDQASTTKLDTQALADDAITAAKLGPDSSIAVQTTEPTTDNFEGRGWFDSASGNLEVYSAGAYEQVVLPTAGIEDNAITTAKIASNAVTTAKIAAAGLGTTALADDAVTTAKIADAAITASQLATNAVTADAIAAGAVGSSELAASGVTYDKIQNVSATDKLLGRSSAGAGVVEEITCTSAGRAVIGAADAAGQRTALGLGTLSTASGTWTNGSTFSGTSSGTNTGDQTIQLTGDVTGLGTGTFAATISNEAVTDAKLASDAVTAVKIAADAVTAAKLADNSATITATGVPTAAGDFVGQQYIDTDTELLYYWTGSAWEGVNSAVPVATTSVSGTVIVGTGLEMGAGGELNHLNVVTAGTYTKVTVDTEGHVTTGTTLADSDVPSLPASKITTGTFNADLFGTNSITGAKLANASTVQFGGAGSTSGVVTFPVADFKGQYFYDELNQDLYIWSGSAWLPITIISGELVLAGTYDASVNQISSVTSAGSAAGLSVGGSLPAASNTNNRYYVVVSDAGTGTGNAPAEALAPPDMILSNGSSWELLDVSNTIAGQTAINISFTPYGNISATNVQTALQELDNEKLGSAGGTITGTLEIGSTGTLSWEGSDIDDYETTLAVVSPTADRTITLPDVTGTVITTGDTGTVTSAMLAGSIADSKLSTISTANKVGLSAVDIDGATDIGGALADADLFIVDDGGAGTNRKAAATRIPSYTFGKVSGDITITSGGTAAIGTGVIVNADINASAAIDGSKIQTATTTNTGAVELATDLETQTGSSTDRAVTPASLQSKISDSTSTTSSTTIASSTAVKAAKDVADAALPQSGGTITGTLSITGSIDSGSWEGSAVGSAYGGTGQTTYTDGQILIGKTDGTLAKTTLTAGSGVTISNGDGSVTISASTSGGTVTSVDVIGGTALTSTGGPVTTSGSITLNLDDTAVNPGSYTYASITVDQQGRITSASNGTTPLTAGSIGTSVQAYDADLAAIAALTGTSGLLRKTAANTWSLDTASYLTSNQTITLSGDLSGSGTTSISATLANSGVSAGTYGSSTSIPSLTIDSKGRVTSATTNSITIGNGTLTVSTSGTGLSGSGTFTANQTGSSSITISSNATSSSTANTIVARDSSQNFSANKITLGNDGVAYSDGSRLSRVGTNQIHMYLGGTSYQQFRTTLFGPSTDNAIACGGSNFRWTTVYAATGTINTSDARAKDDIQSCSLGADFVKSLKPVSYRYKVGSNKVVDSDEDGSPITEEVAGVRTHWGFLAQDVKASVDAAGVDFAGWTLEDKNDPDSQQGLRYTELIAPLTKALQEALERIELLEAKIASLP